MDHAGSHPNVVEASSVSRAVRHDLGRENSEGLAVEAESGGASAGERRLGDSVDGTASVTMDEGLPRVRHLQEV